MDCGMATPTMWDRDHTLICRVQIFRTQFRCGWVGKFELPVIETGARGAEKWLEPKWHQFTTAPKRVSITYEQSRPPLQGGGAKLFLSHH